MINPLKIFGIVPMLVFLAVFAAGGCASLNTYYHENFNYGEITEVSDQEIVFCVGKKERVNIGAIYLVYKFEKRSGGYSRHYVKNRKAVIRVIAMVGDRWARGTIILGTADESCSVEL